MIEGVVASALKIVDVPGGNVLHVMKSTDSGYAGFGEAYFSIIEPNQLKAWKRHSIMTLNLVVPVGTIRFVIYDDRDASSSFGQFQEVTISRKHYSRLTVPPNLWMGFQCIGDEAAMLLNIANIPHNPEEVNRKEIDEIKFDWSLV